MSQIDTWTPPVSGLIFVTGEPGTGKTTFPLTVPGVHPSQIVFFDDDGGKSSPLAKKYASRKTPFGFYANMQALSREKNTKKPLDFYNLFRAQLDLAKKQVLNPKVFIFDYWSNRLEAALEAYAKTKLKEMTDLTDGQIKSSSMLAWPAIYHVHNALIDELTEYAPMVFALNHIKETQIGMVKTGQVEARGQRPMKERPVFSVWCRNNSDPKDGGAPVGLVIKRIMDMQWDEEKDENVPVNILPLRVKPLTWKKIVDYQINPIGTRTPTPEETPSDFELSILSKQLTKDQQDAIRAGRMAMEQEANSANIQLQVESAELKAAVKELADKSVPFPAILEQLREVYPDLNIPKIISIVNSK